MGRWLGWIALVLITAISAARASQVVTPILGPRDTALGGNTVAAPFDGPSILQHNPAGVVAVQDTEFAGGLLLAPVNGRYENAAAHYDEKSAELAMVPVLWLGTGHFAPWHAGVGLRAILGTSFNFHSDPALGPPNGWYLGESGIVQVDVVLGRQLGPLKLAVQAGPTYGRMRLRSPSAFGSIAVDGDGFGVAAGFGALYELGEHATIGLSYRSPGITWIRGGGTIGTQDDNFSLNFHAPQAVSVGLAYQATRRLTVLAQAHWTDYPEFEKSVIHFNQHPELDHPEIADARAVFRYGAGVEYQMTEAVVLRTGIAHEDWMIGPTSLSPLLYDTADTYMGLGVGIRATRQWTIDGTLSKGFSDDRTVSAAQNPSFPGRYSLDTVALNFMITYHFAADSRARPEL